MKRFFSEPENENPKTLPRVEEIDCGLPLRKANAFADRECDIYEFIAHAEDIDSLYLIRAARDRSIYTAEDNNEVTQLWDYLETRPNEGNVQVEVPAKRPTEPSRVAEVE